jgi:hypothetical protein
MGVAREWCIVMLCCFLPGRHVSTKSPSLSIGGGGLSSLQQSLLSEAFLEASGDVCGIAWLAFIPSEREKRKRVLQTVPGAQGGQVSTCTSLSTVSSACIPRVKQVAIIRDKNI